jgi:hypothetical protein
MEPANNAKSTVFEYALSWLKPSKPANPAYRLASRPLAAPIYGLSLVDNVTAPNRPRSVSSASWLFTLLKGQFNLGRFALQAAQ